MRRTIFITTLIAGTLDILAAFIRSYLTNGVMPSAVLTYIASGLFGAKAFDSGAEMLIAGLAVHYAIAFSCTVCFFGMYPQWSLLRKSIFLNSLLIALIAWLVTTQVIIPLSRATGGGFDFLAALVAIGILIICVGLPIAYAAKQYFNRKERR